MGAFSIWHWLVVLAVVVIVMGPGRLPHIGRDLGKAIKGFKESLDGKDVTPSDDKPEQKK